MTEFNRLHAFKLDQSGLARVFGELEAAIMDALWRRGDGTVADVCADLLEDHNYKTIMTVMNRLVEKGTLKRTRRSRAFVYQPSESRPAFEASLSRQVSMGLVRDYGALALAQFVATVDEVNPELLQRLGELVRERTAASQAEAVSRNGAEVAAREPLTEGVTEPLA